MPDSIFRRQNFLWEGREIIILTESNNQTNRTCQVDQVQFTWSICFRERTYFHAEGYTLSLNRKT